MTHEQRSRPARRHGLAAASLLCALLLAAPASAETLPPGIVAEVGKLNPLRLTFDGLCQAAVQHARVDLLTLRGGPRNILEQLIEEEMIAQECERLGISVTAEDVKARWNEIDGRLRRLSNGDQTLAKMVEKDGQTRAEFEHNLRHQLRKERIAEHPENLGGTLQTRDEQTKLQQINIVVGKVRQKTTVRYGVTLLDHVEGRTRPDALPKGQIATVNDVPITSLDFGRALVLRLPGTKVRDYLERECKTALINQAGVALSDDGLASELTTMENLWPLERELQREEVWRTITFKDGFKVRYGIQPEDVRKSRYHRGLIGLVGRERAGVSERQITAEYNTRKDTIYGPHIIVNDILIRFAQKKGIGGDTGLRTYGQALGVAREILRKHASGVPFEKIAADVNRRGDRTLTAHKVRLYKTEADSILYGHAAGMRDGDVGGPFETLSEVHVMRREGPRPARTLAEVGPYVREVLARRKAAAWLKARIEDPTYVRMQWPLRERTPAARRDR